MNDELIGPETLADMLEVALAWIEEVSSTLPCVRRLSGAECGRLLGVQREYLNLWRTAAQHRLEVLDLGSWG